MKKPYIKPKITTRPLGQLEMDILKGVEVATAMGEGSSAGNPRSGALFPERRSAPRYPFIATAVIVDPITRTQLSARTAEISANGCYVDVLNPLPKNTVIQISIQRDTGNFDSWGRVAYLQAGIGMGIAFFETPQEHQRTIEAWIAEVRAFLEKDHQI
jgi:hypothetical protein